MKKMVLELFYKDDSNCFLFQFCVEVPEISCKKHEVVVLYTPSTNWPADCFLDPIINVLQQGSLC